MREGYWWIEAGLGALVMVAPMLGRFTQSPRAMWVDAGLGVALEIWAVIGSHYLGGPAAPDPRLP
jgi:hypothetical protein